MSKDFQDTFKDKVAALRPVESADDVEDVWSKLKTPLLETVWSLKEASMEKGNLVVG